MNTAHEMVVSPEWMRDLLGRDGWMRNAWILDGWNDDGGMRFNLINANN